MKILTLLVLMCFATIVKSQTINVSSFDSIDWNNLGVNENATFCILDDKTGTLLALKHFKKGKKHGLFLTAGRTVGTKVFYAQANYRKDALHGYYASGEESGYYKKGKKDGVWEHTTDTGFYVKTTYKNGVEHGAYYQKSGELVIEGTYKNGKKHGEWKYNDKDGFVNDVEVYKNGEKVRSLRQP